MTLNLYIWLHNLWETNIKLCCLYAYFLTWITRVLKVVLVSIDMETVLDLRHLLIVSLSKKEFTFGRDQQARIVDKNFLKGGGDLYEILTRKKKIPIFPQKSSKS